MKPGVNIKATFAVMNTTWAVVKIRPEKNSGLYGVTITFSKSGRRNCNGQLCCNINLNERTCSQAKKMAVNDR